MSDSDYRILLDAGLTVRQANYWTQRGYIRPSQAHPGSGNWRYYTTAELRVARWMVHLVTNGLSPARAAVLARNHTDDQMSRLVTLLIVPEAAA